MKETATHNGREYRIFTLNLYGTEHRIILLEERYDEYDNLAIIALELDADTSPCDMWAVLTTNICPLADPDTAFVDTNNWTDAEDFIKDNGLGQYLNKDCSSGYCTYPLYRFDTARFYAE